MRTSQPTRTSTTSPPLVNQSQDIVDFVSETRSFNVPSFLLPSLRLETVDERISFQFFVTHAGPALARSSNSIFWQRQVLQAAHQHVSVQHCLMALGAMYRRFFECTSAHVDSDVANQHFQFALRQSNKAIQQLVKQQTRSSSIDAADKLTVMTCCILFGSLANLQGQQQAALDHLRSGIRMLRETTSQSHNRNAHPVSLGSLRSILTGLDIQARSSINWSEIQSWEPFFPTPQPSDAADIDISHPWALSELHCRIETLLNDTLAFNRGCVARPFSDRESIHHEHNALIWRYQRISQTLSSIRSLPLPSSHSPSQGLSRVLLLHAQTQHYLRSSILPLKHHFNISSPLSHTPYDATTLFSDMMSNAVHLLSATSPPGPIYTVAPGPLAALWLIATSAPSSCVALRKRAMELMLSHPRREGLFDGMLAGRIGRVAWGLEQAGARRELSVDGGRGEEGDLVVPEVARMVHVDVHQEGPWRARVKLANAGEVRRGGGTVVWIEW
ncbi:hypothetical protein EKO04_000067 [Ascochyta lentis]|uniref:Uncharacterized protein n=1 Tax=Ascochyta lentis TaxID=205686 RepID=A0A8H7JEI4_9PLEO|nr:hypothetical protein EKO04_000067 [Ascochyta lentis]